MYERRAAPEFDGARFEDRVTGKLSSFCPHARKVYIDIEPASINRTVKVDAPLVGDADTVLRDLMQELGPSLHLSDSRRGGTASSSGVRGAAWPFVPIPK